MRLMVWPALIVCRVLKTRCPVSGRQRDFHGFAVANLTDQNDFWRLTKSRAQAGGKSWEVFTEFALAKSGLGMGVQKFDRIFQGNDVHFLRLIELVEHGGKRGRFSCPGSARE